MKFQQCGNEANMKIFVTMLPHCFSLSPGLLPWCLRSSTQAVPAQQAATGNCSCFLSPASLPGWWTARISKCAHFLIHCLNQKHQGPSQQADFHQARIAWLTPLWLQVGNQIFLTSSPTSCKPGGWGQGKQRFAVCNCFSKNPLWQQPFCRDVPQLV